MAQREATAMPRQYPATTVKRRCDNSRRQHISPCSVSLGNFCRGQCKPVIAAKPGGPSVELSLESRCYCASLHGYIVHACPIGRIYIRALATFKLFNVCIKHKQVLF